MAGSYIEMFEEELYPPVFQAFAAGVVEDFDKNREKITRTLKSILSGYLDSLCKMQEAHLAQNVAQITFSLLYTSFEEKRIEFQIDSYEEGGLVYGETLLAERFPAPWLAGELSGLMKMLEERVTGENLRRYIRPAELERLGLRALRSLLTYFTGRFRYVIADALDGKKLAALKKEETFIISMGEYLDWQKVIFALRPRVDLFHCEPGTTLNFRRFSAIHYEGKNFRGMEIHNARFTDCTFRDCTIEECQMNDSIFDGCTFQNVLLKETKMYGCLFINCILQKCEFQEVSFHAKEADNDRDVAGEVYYEPAEFLTCVITGCGIEDSDLRKVLVKDCDIHNMRIENSAMDDSDFEDDERITRL